MPRQATKRIVELWGIGASAEETLTALHEEGIRVCLQTIYNKRHSLTAQEMIDELIRKQLRDITVAEGPLKLKYRDKLLEKLIPQRIEAMGLSRHEEHLIVELWNPTAEGGNPLLAAQRSEAVPPGTVQN